MFIRRDGLFVSTDEADGWIEESQKLAEESNYNEAMTLALKALSWFQSAGPSTADENGLMQCYAGEGASLEAIGIICAACENWKEAAGYFQQARDAWMKAWEYQEDAMMSVNAGQRTNYACLNLAVAAAHLDKYQESLELADGALGFFEKTENPGQQIRALRLSGGAHAMLGDKKQAAERFRRAARLAHEVGDRDLEKEINSQIKRVSK